MARNESYTIRLGLKGGKVVTAELGRVGVQGERSFQRIEKSGKGATRTMGDMSRLILTRLVPAFAAMRVGRSIFDNMQQFELIDTRLKRLAKTSEDYAEIQGYLRDKSDELNIGIATLADSYARLLALEDSEIINRDEVNALAEGFANLKAALGVDDSQIGNVLYGISQAFSQGTVQAQELNQVIEPVPGFLNRIAKAAGEDNPQAFREMVKAGEVSSEAFKGYVLGALKEYEGAAGDITDTSVAAVTRLNNAWVNLSRTIGETFLTETSTRFANVATIWVMALDDIAESAKNAYIELGILYDNYMRLQGSSLQGSPVSFPNGSIAVNMDGESPDVSPLGRDFAGRLQEDMNAVMDQIRKMNEIAANTPVPKRKPDEIIGRGIDEREKAEEAARKAAEAELKKINDVIEGLRFKNAQILRNEKEQAVYNELRAAGVAIDSEAGQEIKALVEQHYMLEQVMDSGKDVTEGAAKALQDYAKAARDTEQQLTDMSLNGLQTMEDSLVNLVKGTESVSEAFGNMADSIIEDLIRMQIRQNITAPLSEGLNGLISGIGTPMGKHMLNGVFGTAPSLNPGAVQLAGFAKGGITTRPAIFGEAGPEAAVPLPDGRSIPVDMRGGGFVNEINVINNNNSDVSVTESRGSNGKNIINVVLDAVARDMTTPGGKTNRALKNMNGKRLIK